MKSLLLSSFLCFGMFGMNLHASELEGEGYIPDHLGIDNALSYSSENYSSENADKNIFGQDDRRSMTSTQYPWSAIVKIKVADIGECTGSLIWKNLVLTKAHCVIKADGTLTTQPIYVHPNYMNGSSRSQTHATYAWWGTNNWRQFGDHDYAVLKLAEPLGQQYGYLGWKPIGWSNQVPSWNFTLAGYSGDFDRGQTAGVHVGCHLREQVGAKYYHDCDATRGSSGGPVFGTWNDKTNVNYQIVGLNSGEFRNGGDRSLRVNQYSRQYANVAIMAAQFAQLLQRLRAENP